jgi:hypothetical protein
MADGRMDVACVGRQVTHTWEQIINRYETDLLSPNRRIPGAALGRALSQFASNPQELIDMLRNPQRDARTRALAYAVEQFAGVLAPRNPLHQFGAEGVHAALANLIEQGMRGIMERDRGVGARLGELGLGFALPALLEPDAGRGVGLARTGIAENAAELDRIARMPRFRGGPRRPEEPPEAPSEYVPCGHGPRFGAATGHNRLAKRQEFEPGA